MSTIPLLTERDIRAFVTEQNLVNGQRYVREGAIFDARQHGATLRASCKGSQGEIYKVQVTFAGKDIEDSFCTCPAAEHGYCKHIAALLWAWHKQPADFIAMDKVEAELTELTNAELISLMKWPLIASLILPWLLVYLGLHIVQRGVIFVDLALAQTAAPAPAARAGDRPNLLVRLLFFIRAGEGRYRAGGLCVAV